MVTSCARINEKPNIFIFVLTFQQYVGTVPPVADFLKASSTATVSPTSEMSCASEAVILVEDELT